MFGKLGIVAATSFYDIFSFKKNIYIYIYRERERERGKFY